MAGCLLLVVLLLVGWLFVHFVLHTAEEDILKEANARFSSPGSSLHAERVVWAVKGQDVWEGDVIWSGGRLIDHVTYYPSTGRFNFR